MNAKTRSVARIGLILSSALAVAAAGCATHVHQRTVYVPTPVVEASPPVQQPPTPLVVVQPSAPPVMVIHSENDFYEPLSPYGSWVVVAGYGRCWVPARVEVGWRPYSAGYWQRTDAGWYWMSDEPWGWATYHYGRWDWSSEFGWIWLPQTQWAPAWVAWREGGGYIGWAPLRPSIAIGVGLTSVNDEPAFASRAYVFVEHRRMLEPVRSKTVIVNNTTIINQTVNITKVNVVNKTVINEGPRLDVVERESGRKIQSVAAREFRRQEETAMTVRERNVSRSNERKTQSTIRTEVEARSTPRREEQIVQRAPAVTRATTAISQPRPTAPISSGRQKRDGMVSRSEHKVEMPVSVKERDHAMEVKKSKPEFPAVQSIPNRPAVRTIAKATDVASKPLQAPAVGGANRTDVNKKAEHVSLSERSLTPASPSIALKSESKREHKQPANLEAKSKLSKVSGRNGISLADSSQPGQMSPREASRNADLAEAGLNGQGQGQKKPDH